MFTTLIASRRARCRLGWQGMLSLLAHVGVGGALVRATATVTTPAGTRIYDTIPIPLPPAVPKPPRPATPSSPSLPSRPLVVTPSPPIPVVTDIREVIPPADPSVAWDPARFRGLLTPPGACVVSCDAAAGSTAAYTMEQVDEPARVLHQPRPEYPPLLQQAGLGGRVELRFVIDTTGVPESASIQVLSSSHPGFEPSAIATIRQSRFIAGKVKGRTIRQVFRQGFTFRMER